MGANSKGGDVGKYFAILFALIFSGSVWAIQLTQEQKLSDFNQLIGVIESGYGPLEFKQKVRKMNLDVLKATYKDRITQTQTNADFYYLIREFIAEFEDGHFGANIPSNYKKFLPIVTDLVEGKVYITHVKREKKEKGFEEKVLSTEEFPFEKGDEIVSVNGVKVQDVLDQLQKYTGSGYELTERRLASWWLFSRRGARVPVPKEDTVRIEVRKGTSEAIQSVELKWFKGGQPIDEDDHSQGMPKPLGLLSSFEERKAPYQDIHLVNELAVEHFEDHKADGIFACSGGTRVKIPEDATMIVKEPFVAYYHSTEKGNIGYLRIPHYSPRDKFGRSDAELRFKEYEYAISELEKNTVGLVIDQDHNCGGSVFYLERIVGLFMSEPYSPMIFNLRANKEEILSIRSWLDGEGKNTIFYKAIESVVELIEKTWKAGSYLTEDVSLRGYPIEKLQPNHVRYTKPILMLIDEISGSGGDAFPALMQGYGRATLLGTRTSGLGGHVVGQPPLAYSRIPFRMTKSLFFRPDGVPVENNGAVPDIEYKHTWNDLMYEYQDYQKFYTQQLLKLVD